MTDQTAAFVDWMRSLGIPPADSHEIIADDKRRRYRLDGDKPKVRNGSYQLRCEADGFAVGWARSFRDGITHKYTSKASRNATQEDREAWKARADAARAKAAQELKDLQEKAAIKAERIWGDAARVGVTEYMTRKGITALHGARIWRDMLVVPLRMAGKLSGLQFILADGSKRFLTGGAKESAYHSIADKGEDLSRIVICEGYATGVKLREALSLPVIVAFDAGNLKPVAKVLRGKYPSAEIIIAADNDQWTVKPDGTPYNAGIHWAQQAAGAIGGARVVAPVFPADDPERRTDWDDVARSDGLDAIRAAFAPVVVETAPDPEPVEIGGDWQPEVNETSDPMDAIRPLGHNRGTYAFFPRAAGQIVTLTASALGRIQNLYQLAPRSFWEMHYSIDGKTADSTICAMASAHLMEACHKRGIFEAGGAKGVGAWIDSGVAIVNCGDMIVTSDGRRAHPAEFRGEHVYESGHRVINLGVEPATNKEAARLLDLCKMLKFKRPQYAVLLAGWIVVAPIGGALKWCPHIWLTGRAGSGKSWVLSNIAAPAIGRIGIKRDGGTSEAGIRKALGTSSRPYLLDEAESQNGQRAIETEKILALLRGASSGSVVENAFATYQVKSCFALAAIIPRIEQVADQERITLLELLKNDAPNSDEQFMAIEDAAHDLLTPQYSDALFARTIENVEVLLKNVKVFSRAAAKVFKNKRSGDQLGPMIAGAYLLTTTKEISLDDAQKWIERQNWDWHTEGYSDSDAAKLLTYLMTARVNYDHEGMSRAATIGDLVQQLEDKHHPSYRAAYKALRSYGITVKGHELLISNSAPNLRRLLRDTQYIPWNRTLADFPGANNYGGKAVNFAVGLTSKVTALPLAAVMGVADNDEELPIYGEEDFK